MSSSKHQTREQQAKVLRTVRKIHRSLGAALFVLFLIISITGLLLGWKKHSGGRIQAPTMKGQSTDLAKWISTDSLYSLACGYLRDSVDADLSLALEKIDVRPDKGIAKFIFAEHFWGLQLDCTTGALLLVERRNSDLIEKIHDGSIVDMKLLGNGSAFKLLVTSVTGLALLLFTVTGFWLWYGPKRMRATR